MTRLSRRQCCARLATLRCGFAAARCATVSPQEERQIGRKEAEELERTVGLVRERRIVEYVEAIGARLARAAGRSDIAWQWSVADEPDANAFALPGGASNSFIRGLARHGPTADLPCRPAFPANVLLLDEPFLLCHRRAMRREHSPRQCYAPSLVWQACSFAMHDFAGDRMDEDIRRPIARALKWHTPHATRGESCREGDHGQEGDGYGPCSLPHLAQRCLASASQAQVEQARALRVQAEGNVAKAEAYPEAVA